MGIENLCQAKQYVKAFTKENTMLIPNKIHNQNQNAELMHAYVIAFYQSSQII